VAGKASGRNSIGYIGQATFSPKDSKWMFGASFGENHLKQNDDDKAASGSTEEVLKETAIVGQITFKWTKSLRWVAEYTNTSAHTLGVKVSTGNQGSIGMMLFY
jgi:hypothetical protein